MKFLLYGERGGGGREVEAPDLAQAVTAFQDSGGGRATAVSVWCENPLHRHAPDGQWHSADGLLDELD